MPFSAGDVLESLYALYNLEIWRKLQAYEKFDSYANRIITGREAQK